MATALPIKYPLDLSGLSNNNKVDGEITTTAERQYKVIVPKSTPFFAESFSLWDDGTNTLLVQGVDYKLVEPVGMATVLSGKVIYSTVVVTKKSTTNRYRYNYQALGGDYQTTYEAIRIMLENAANDSRPVSWPNVINRSDTFAPTMHTHSAGDLIGFETLVSTLDKLRDTLLLGDSIGHDEVLLYLQSKIDALVSLMNEGQNSLIAVAISRATSASVEATNALRAAQASDSKALAALQLSQATQAQLGDLRSLQASSEASARAILNSYPNLFTDTGSSNLSYQTPTGATGPLLFPSNESTGIISTDFYGISTDGRVIMGSFGDTTPATPANQYAFKVTLTLSKPITGGQAQIDIKINVFDQRASNGVGDYASNCSVTLLPIEIDDGANDLVSVFASASSYSYTELSKDGQVRGASFVIDGAGQASASINATVSQQAVNATKMGQYLLDCRSDYNVLGYGLVNSRRGVILSLPTGSEFNLSFKLSGVSLSEIRKRISLVFRHRMDISRATLTGNSVSTQLRFEGPDTSKFRAVSASF